ncbi:ectoine/hydroxyectoine ABC transporter permease subunit EhuC [Caballeronia sp. GAWG2-1]|uniref:ectoine/hydroxyectoine ABC transporter permease subunit EhuC n=1 Tax=Caballeronia sp. GAWG2-1 TaxID=2921744 RepID=UPI002027D706|nr:ectoine/hydroxyectoine ABC transporter permease subunit EhuC [Caballeronia sp. GAWG2-1]
MTTNRQDLVSGVLVTLEVYGCSIVLGTVLSVALAFMKLSPVRVIRYVSVAYVEVFRSTPLMIQLFWLYYVLPLLGLSFAAGLVGVLSLGSNMGAYGSEAVIGALRAVPRGQYEISVALNLSPLKRMTRIIFPQAMRLFLPTWGNLLVEYLKYSSLVSLIAIPDLMYQVKSINGLTMQSAQAFGTALILYYVLSRLIIIPLFNMFEKMWAKRMGIV